MILLLKHPPQVKSGRPQTPEKDLNHVVKEKSNFQHYIEVNKSWSLLERKRFMEVDKFMNVFGI